MYRDSEPVTSPLMTNDLPIVAWSEPVVATAGRGAAELEDGSLTTGAEGIVALGRSGSAGLPGVAG